ncbi:MAG: Mur ligase, partial [Gemmatimonadota bacterium]
MTGDDTCIDEVAVTNAEGITDAPEAGDPPTGDVVMVLEDSRRLTGPNLLLDRAGAVLDIEMPDALAEPAIEAWESAARRMLGAIGWDKEQTAVHRFPGGASLAISAPIDALYAATEVNEWALAAANKALINRRSPSLDDEATRLRGLIVAESSPAMIALRDAAGARGVRFLWGDGVVSVGSGTGARSWPIEKIPSPDAVPWDVINDVPVALVTGSNGKTTTVRLLGAMIASAGLVPGVSSTDSVSIGGEPLVSGDWAGPGGARLVLRDSRVQVAILETARGGILRRGLAVERAEAAL